MKLTLERSSLKRSVLHPAFPIVGIVWAGLVLFNLVQIFEYGRNIPLAEEWFHVAPLTGHEPQIGRWAWEQVQEHRIPVPRLFLLGTLLVTGDFRAGMVLNLVLLAGLSIVMVLAARSLRGGAIHYAEAFFPLLWLHPGNWYNIGWGWQFQFVVSVTFTCVLLVAVVRQEVLFTPRVGLPTGVSLMLLPLCGANGLMYTLALAPWIGGVSFLRWRTARTSGETDRMSLFLQGSAGLALILVGVYFVGYVRPYWNPPPESIGSFLKTASKFLAMSFGPAAGQSWSTWTMAVAGVMLSVVWVLLRSVLNARGAGRLQAAGLLLFLGGTVVLALAIGWGRAAWVPTAGMPGRYVLLAAPLLALAYYTWILFGSTDLRKMGPAALLIGMVILLPANTKEGWVFRDWYHEGMNRVEQDLNEDTPLDEVAERHQSFLLHWDRSFLEDRMRMLERSGLGPFGGARGNERGE